MAPGTGETPTICLAFQVQLVIAGYELALSGLRWLGLYCCWSADRFVEGSPGLSPLKRRGIDDKGFLRLGYQ
ncbi:hypothetical protein SV7mr_25230 [Stieleria bergensis]|uniref:Uncharacterized protein n=1 Tax=Stieleria bergensis TaxID=2528025 RepID=A0A517SV48_9BACT|nr:hypothetical protein SV7mr_25230 [Planctomycetes bacterium SV_7m_r]